MLPGSGGIFRFCTNTFAVVPVERIPIDAFLNTARGALLLDVRSPGEYHHAHMPGAYSLPLFTNEERAIVGTAYKQQSREQAIKIGLDFFGPKMRRMVEEVEGLYDLQNQNYGLPEEAQIQNSNSKIVCIYCWRGGMRSGAVAWLLGLYGFSVYVLQGGYKRFRQWVLEKVEQPYDLKLIGGYTGSGKTGLLHELEHQGETVIDLEALAAHKGSAFGNIGLPKQPSQEQFENKLAFELYQKTSPRTEATSANQHTPTDFFKTPCPVWIEDESQRIGTINIPAPFWNTMRNAPVYFLNIPFEERLQHLVSEYGDLNKAQMIEAIGRISKRLGPLETKQAIQFLEAGNVAESFRILLHYYDKQYRKALHNRQNLPNLLHEISCAHVCTGNAQLLSKSI
jgi:tRNA 2-selenouridine synthase